MLVRRQNGEENLIEERRDTRKLIEEAKETALEGARVTERLRIATEQYRERLGRRPTQEPRH